MLSHPSIDGPTAVLVTVAAGGIGSLLALFALTVDETDEVFANMYSAARLEPERAHARAAAAAHRRDRDRVHGRARSPST